MNYLVVNKETGNKISFQKKLVFEKLLAAHGPKRRSKNEAERWVKAYALAQKDFEDLYGITPEVIWNRVPNRKIYRGKK